MRIYKHVLLICGDEFRATELRLVMETRMAVKVTIASSVDAVKSRSFHCAVLIHGDIEVIDFLRAREIPTLEIGQSPSYADRVVSGKHMMDVLEAVKVMCVRKRGPRKAVAA